MSGLTARLPTRVKAVSAVDGPGPWAADRGAGSATRGRTTRRRHAWPVIRGVAIIAAALALYSLLPMSEVIAPAVALVACLGIAALALVFGRRLRRVSASPRPLLAAVESLLLLLGLFVTLTAFVYVAMSASDPGAFSEPLNKVAGIYLAVTILSTVGFGDITAQTDLARLVVTAQMVVDLVLLGTAVKLLGFSARQGVQARMRGGEAEPDGPVSSGPIGHAGRAGSPGPGSARIGY